MAVSPDHQVKSASVAGSSCGNRFGPAGPMPLHGRFFAARSPFVEKGIGRGALLVGAAADDAVRFGPHQQMPQRILREWNAPLIQRFSDFLFRPVFVPFQRLLQQLQGTRQEPGGKFGVGAPGERFVGGTDTVGGEESIQRRSFEETKCHVGRNRCVRRMSPLFRAASICVASVDAVRQPTAHLAIR